MNDEDSLHLLLLLLLLRIRFGDPVKDSTAAWCFSFSSSSSSTIGITVSLLLVGSCSLVHVPVLMSLHLRQPEHGVLALPAVVVRLLAVVGAIGHGANLRGRVLLEAGGDDGVQLLVLATMSNHLVGVRAEVVALQAVEVA